MLPEEDRAEIILRQGGLCFYCGERLGPYKPGHGPIFDHVIPRNAGGKHDKSNRVAAHNECDGAKGGRMPTPDEIERLHQQIAEQESCPADDPA
jgi:5-methylcytosine-specific restriction endonuclease McrA